MATRDTIVIGASAGGVHALMTLVASLPADLPAAVFIVLHVSPNLPSLLPTILMRDSNLPVAHATDGEKIMHGRVYVAPPDQHLIIEDRNEARTWAERKFTPPVDRCFVSFGRTLGRPTRDRRRTYGRAR